MELYNINSEICEKENLLNEICNNTKNLENFQLIELQDNCIFSKIVKEIISKNGMNVKNVFLEYYSKTSKDCVRCKPEFLIKNRFLIMSNQIILPLTNNGDIFVHNERNIMYNFFEFGECILVNTKYDFQLNSDNFIVIYLTNLIDIMNNDEKWFYQEINKHSISIFKNSINYKKNIRLISLPRNKFRIMSDILYYDNIFDDFNSFIEKGNYNKNVNEKLIFKIVKNDIKNKISLCDVNNKNIQLIEDNDSLNLYELKKNMVDVMKIYFNSDIEENYFKKMCTDFNENISNICKNKFLYEEDIKIVFLNNDNLTYEEVTITNICKDVFENNNNLLIDYDIAIVDKYCNNYHMLKDLAIYTIIIVFDYLEEDDIFLIDSSGEFEYDSIKANINSNYKSIIKPDPLTIICCDSRYINFKSNKNFIQIIIYNRVSSNLDKYCGYRKEKVNYISNNISTKNNILLDPQYTKIPHMLLSTYDSNSFYIENLLQLYKPYLKYSKFLKFFYKPNITFINDCHCKNSNIFNINEFDLNKNLLNFLFPIYEYISNIENIVIIDNIHPLFKYIFYIYKNIIITGIEEIFSSGYSFNMIKCFITPNINNTIFNNIYDDIHDNKNNNLIIYASINLDFSNENFGKTMLYTNYVNIENKNYTNKNTLEFIIEAKNI